MKAPPNKTAAKDGKNIKIVFPFSQDDLAKVKSLPGRKYNGQERFWTCPYSLGAVEQLQSWGFSLSPDLAKALFISQSPIPEIKDVPGLRISLFPYQKHGVSFIDAKNGRVILADEMGLGKTIQALAWLHLRKDKALPAMVVCPASLKLNWAWEALKFTDLEPVVISGGKKKVFQRFPGGNGNLLYIINYDILHQSTVCPDCRGKKVIGWEKCGTCKGKGKTIAVHPGIADLGIKTLVMDEIHNTKSNAAARTTVCKKLAKTVEHVIGISGTPLVNRPFEFFNSLNMVDPSVTGGFLHFTKRYCAAYNNGFGMDYSGSSNTEELHLKLISTVMLRRLKKEVLPELPDKIRSIIPIELENPAEYAEVEDDFVAWAKREKGKDVTNAEALVRISALRQMAVKNKLKASIEWIADFLDAGEKLIVFGIHKFVIEAVMSAFPGISVKIDGSVKNETRQSAVEQFQNNPKIRLFVGNIDAAGEGITLTAASAVVFLELPWTPAELSQAEDRAHRIGQKSTVNIYFLLAIGTIEEEMAALIDQKITVFNAVMNGQKPKQKQLLSSILAKYKQK
jgi:SWI/SNF-related matrix-associated actin-dependent regulator 1 of chromatin subfamily A